jgi:protein phosphatase
VARGNDLFLVNVGDSRAYLLRNGQLRQITRDHSFVEEQIRAGILTREEARHHPQRNVITRALGAKPEVEVDTYQGTLVPGDTLLLCSDGLSEPVGEKDIELVLKQHPPAEAVPRLIGLANSRGGGDNISALVVQAVPAAAAEPATQPTMPVPAASAAAVDEATVPAAPTAPAAAPAKTKSTRGLSTPVILGLGAGGLLILAALAAGALFLVPSLMSPEETLTPTPMPTAEPTTAAPTAGPTATPRVAEASTATPRMGFGSLEPEDGAVFSPGEEVHFRWSVVGRLPAIYESVVRTNHEAYAELCRSSDEPCPLPEEPGTYQWWIELSSGGVVLLKSDPRTLTIQSPSTETTVPSPTATLPESPQGTPEDTGGS